MTGRDILSASLRLIGALASGESLEAAQATDGLAALNRMMANWSTESLLIYDKVRETFPTVASQQTYTMGVGGNFNTTRPLQIESALIQIAGTSPAAELPLKILNLDEYSTIILKTLTSSIPQYIYTEGAFPLENVSLWPVPNSVQTLVLYSWKALSSWTTLSTDVSLPPGYDESIIYNLAIRLGPEYSRPISQEIMAIAMETKANLKRMNFRPDYLRVDSALRGQSRAFNYYTGETV